MTRKQTIKNTLIAGLFCLALGGWLLHLRIHPPAKDADNLVPFIAGALSTLALPLLFWFRRTSFIAYIINGFCVIIGTITMAQFSIVHWNGPVTLSGILLNTTLADIAMLWVKFALGKAIFDLEFLKSEADAAPKGRYWRYPNMGWWWVHLAAVSAVYALANIFWK